MTTASLADGDNYDDWTDPNLTEPKFQDDLYRRLNDDFQRRGYQRPRAARRELRPADIQAQEMRQIRYFKYTPYSGMSEPERKKYLNLEPTRLTSSRTVPAPRRQERRGTTAQLQRQENEASFWPSASKTKSLKVYDYHLAELSLTYRSPPSLLEAPRQLVTPPGEQQRQRSRQPGPKSLYFQRHSSRYAPASAPTFTQQLTLAEKTTQVSLSGDCTPLLHSAMSEHYPTEPGDVVSKSESNRILNVVSVDECHIQHRRRRRRFRRVASTGRKQESGDEGSCTDEEEEDEQEEEEEVRDADRSWGEELTTETADNEIPTANTNADLDVTLPKHKPIEAPPMGHHAGDTDALAFLQSAGSTRPTTERRKAKKRSEKEMRQLAAAKFLRRNEILREKMAIYLDWKLTQERLGNSDIRVGDPAARFERFTVELVREEAVVANQYRGGGVKKGDGHVIPDAEFASPRVTPTLHQDGERRTELSLTEMFEALKA